MSCRAPIITRTLAKLNEGTIKGLLVSTDNCHKATTTIIDTVPDVKILVFTEENNIHELFLFLLLNKKQKVLLDTGDLFKEASPSTIQKVANMISRALDGVQVHSFSGSRTFVFEGQIILVTNHRHLVPKVAKNRMYIC